MPSKRPIIGCATYRKTIVQANPIDIYGLMPSYTEAVVAAGGIPLLIPLGLSDGDLQTIIDRVDGLLIPGGGDVEPGAYGGQLHGTLWGLDADRDGTEFVITRSAVEQRKPLLAICRGIQVVNVALGGTLWEDISSLVPDAIAHDNPDDLPRNHLAHKVGISRGSALERLMCTDEIWVNSLHHQAIRDLSPELAVTGMAPDGLIEAVEVPGHPFFLGVQWHPENLVRDVPTMLNLFKGLVEASNGFNA